jgi:hypothetical protein
VLGGVVAPLPALGGVGVLSLLIADLKSEQNYFQAPWRSNHLQNYFAFLLTYNILRCRR